MRELIIKAACLVAAVPAASKALEFLLAGRLFWGCMFVYLSWASYAVVFFFLAIKCDLLEPKNDKNAINAKD